MQPNTSDYRGVVNQKIYQHHLSTLLFHNEHEIVTKRYQARSGAIICEAVFGKDRMKLHAIFWFTIAGAATTFIYFGVIYLLVWVEGAEIASATIILAPLLLIAGVIVLKSINRAREHWKQQRYSVTGFKEDIIRLLVVSMFTVTGFWVMHIVASVLFLFD